jgi:sugar lactone lactonase YvrE
MASPAKILGIDPVYAIAGGEVIIDCVGFDTRDPQGCAVLIGDVLAQIVAIGPRRVLAIVPETKGGELDVRLQSGTEISEPARLTVARKLAGDLHPVANPAFDPDDGALFVTRSGSRGEELPVTLFRIDVSGELTEYSGDIPNPTGIAFSPDGQMYVTSRLEGVVYKITPFKEAVAFARNLGVATCVGASRAFGCRVSHGLRA